MYGEELELSRLAIYLVIDYYMRIYSLVKHNKKHFTLSNGLKYRIKYVYTEYWFLRYHSLFNRGNVGLNKDNCDYYIFVYPVNSRMLYRQDFKFFLIKTDSIIDMIIQKQYITDSKRLFSSKYKFSVNSIINNSTMIL
jgi:hypothetical protein